MKSYFLQDKETGLFWQGQKRGKGAEWAEKIKIFSSAAALYRSLYSPIPSKFVKQYEAKCPRVPYPKPFNREDYSKYSEWRRGLRRWWNKFKNENGLTSFNIIQYIDEYNLYEIDQQLILDNAQILGGGLVLKKLFS